MNEENLIKLRKLIKDLYDASLTNTTSDVLRYFEELVSNKPLIDRLYPKTVDELAFYLWERMGPIDSQLFYDDKVRTFRPKAEKLLKLHDNDYLKVITTIEVLKGVRWN